ncbi:unnamed protein product [Ambrosiozyma monospora]|uniref:Unnamed protein product n=1 Tax=Ambrosiozyma monospora TaxID=43982 RepID=A0ACB5U6V2_AMBMO|nr:unnamed protein product [Ambrosiozyma monospora]
MIFEKYSSSTKYSILTGWIVSILVVQLATVFQIYNPHRDTSKFDHLMTDLYKKNPQTSVGANPLNSHTTFSRLSKALPYDSVHPGPIPKNIYQVWLGDKVSDFPDTPFYDRWHNYNPNYNHKFLHDSDIQEMFDQKFKEVGG